MPIKSATCLRLIWEGHCRNHFELTEPNEFAGEIHDRLPVFLTEPQFASWLSGPFDNREKEFSSYSSLTKAAQPPFEVVTTLATALLGDPMGIESLTYAELGDRFGVSPEAARSLARRLRLSRRPGNDGKVRITVDLAEIQYKPLPAHSANNHPSDISDLNARVEQLEGELARREVEKQCLEVQAAGHRADFEYERERSDTLLTETLKLGQLAMSAREKAARLEGVVSAAWGRRRWWRQLVAQTSRRAVRLDSPRPGPVLVGVPVRI
jgi:hypothetical protein